MILTFPSYLETARLRVDRGDGRGLPLAVWRRQAAAELALRERFRGAGRQAAARIPKPETSQRLWQQHKYSMLARDEHAYRETGPAVARGELDFETLERRLDSWLSAPPSPGGLRNAAEHMWGHVSAQAAITRSDIGDDPFDLLEAVGRETVRQDNAYLLEQAALSELPGWQDE